MFRERGVGAFRAVVKSHLPVPVASIVVHLPLKSPPEEGGCSLSYGDKFVFCGPSPSLHQESLVVGAVARCAGPACDAPARMQPSSQPAPRETAHASLASQPPIKTENAEK